MTALVAGTLILLINGVIYAWSIYSGPLGEGFGWTSSQLGLCFTVIMAFFCLGGVLGSRLCSRLGIGLSVPIGGALGCAGFLLCCLLDGGTLWLLYAAFAVSSLGVGVVYNNVISGVTPRFPAKKGLASGVMMMGFGASSLVLGSLAGALIASPLGWRATYALTGALLLAAGLAGRVFLTPPADDGQAVSQGESVSGLTTRQMLGTPSFWLYFLIATVASGFGAGIIGHARYIALEAGAGAGLATLTVGLLSVCNGLGRLSFGLYHDRFGFRASLLTSAAVYIAGALTGIAALRSASPALVTAALMLCGLGYGAIPVISAAVAGEFFGRAHYASNYSVVNLNILPASFAAAIAGGIQTASGSYRGALVIFLALECAAAALTLVLSAIRKKAAP